MGTAQGGSGVPGMEDGSDGIKDIGISIRTPLTSRLEACIPTWAISTLRRVNLGLELLFGSVLGHSLISAQHRTDRETTVSVVQVVRISTAKNKVKTLR